ncbi:MAG: hypothetical protein ABIJ61_12380, partial [bacterium]
DQRLIRGIAVALLCLTPGVMLGQQPEATNGRLFVSDVELLRIGEQRLYFWLPAEALINSDFTIELSARGEVLVSCGVAAIAEQVIVSEILSDSVIDLVRSNSTVQGEIYLDQTRLSTEPPVLGLPHAFTRISSASDSLWPQPLFGRATYSSYFDLAAAEVDLAVGGLQLLLLPRGELDSDLNCDYQVIPTSWRIEWYLATDLSDYDLLPAALSYCLKGSLADRDFPLSTIIDSLAAARYFPADPGNAAALFEQMPAGQAQRRIGCNDTKAYPTTLSLIRRQLNNCGGSVSVGMPDSATAVYLVPILVDGEAKQAYQMATQRLRQSLLATGCSWAELLGDSSLVAPELSRRLSRQLKLIPLGAQQLVLVVRPEVHQIGGFFYRVAQK